MFSAEPSTLSGSIVPSPSEQPREISLWERLGSSEMMDIECNDFSWSSLSSLHHTEHSSSSEQPENEMSKVMEVAPFSFTMYIYFLVLMWS